MQFVPQPLFVIRLASSCSLNLNCSKLNYREQTAHTSIRTTKYCTKSPREAPVPSRIGLDLRELSEGTHRRSVCVCQDSPRCGDATFFSYTREFTGIGNTFGIQLLSLALLEDVYKVRVAMLLQPRCIYLPVDEWLMD